MKKRRRNAKAARNKKQQQQIQSPDNFEEVPITIKEEILEGPMEIDPLAFNPIKTEPDVKPIIMDRILLPESTTDEFFDENKKDIKLSLGGGSSLPDAMDQIPVAAPKQELEEVITSDVMDIQIKTEPADSQYEVEVGVQQMMDGVSVTEEISQLESSTLTQEMLQEPDEMKLDIEETWPDVSTCNIFPDVSQVFVPQHCDEDVPISTETSMSTDKGNTSEATHKRKPQGKRRKRQSRKTSKKVCSGKLQVDIISTETVSEQCSNALSSLDENLSSGNSISGNNQLKTQSIQEGKKLLTENVQVDKLHPDSASGSTGSARDVPPRPAMENSKQESNIKTQPTKETTKICVETIQVDYSDINTKLINKETQTNSTQKKNASTNYSVINHHSKTDSTSESAKKSDYYVCHLCSITYTCIEKLNKHVTKNHKNYVYCSKCKFLIKTNNKVIMKSHESTCCNVTANVLSSIIDKLNIEPLYEKLDEDQRDESSDDGFFPKPEHFLCHLCDEHFSNIEGINLHVSENHKKHMYCKKCRFLIKIANRNELEKHNRVCCKLLESKTLVYCNVCAKSFFSVAKMLKHVKDKHSNEEIKNKFNYNWLNLEIFECSYCIAKFQTKTAIETHLVKQHFDMLTYKNAKSPYAVQTYIKCIYCNECYTSLKIVISHISSRHPDQSNITLNSFPVDKCTNNYNFKLETGSQTEFQDLDFLAYLYKSKKMEALCKSNNKNGKSKSNQQMPDKQNEKCNVNDDSTQKVNDSSSGLSTNLTRNKNTPIETTSKITNVSSLCKKDNVINANFIPKRIKTEIVYFEKYICIKEIENKLLYICTKNRTSKPNVKYCIYCSTCKLECTDLEYISNHVKTCLINAASKLPCPFCDQYVDTTSTFLKHLEIHHTKLGIFQCEKCNTAFYKQSNYDNHMLKHATQYSTMKTLVQKCSPGIHQHKYTESIQLPRVETNIKKPNDTPVNNPTQKITTQNPKMCNLLNTCRTYCEKFKLESGKIPSIHCTACLLDIPTDRYFSSLHLLNCLNKTKNIACIFCPKIVNSNMFNHMFHLVQHFESNSLIPLACQICNFNFLSTYNQVIHRRYKKCKGKRQVKILNDNVTVVNSIDRQKFETSNAMKSIQLAFCKIKSTLKNNEQLIVHCSTCKKDIKESDYLTNHVQTCVNEEQKYVCSFCDKHETTNRMIMNLRNIMTHITITYSEKIDCTKCNSVFFTSYNRDCHFHTHITQSSNEKHLQPSTISTAEVKTQRNPILRKIHPSDIKLTSTGQIKCKILPKNINIQSSQFSGASPQFLSSLSSRNVKYLIVPANSELLNTIPGTPILLSNTNAGNNCNPNPNTGANK